MSTTRRNSPIVHRGYLVAGPIKGGRTVDGFRRSDQEQEGDPDDVVEIHNHLPYDPQSVEDEEPEQQNGEEIARYPASGFTCRTEGDEIVVYRTGSGSDGPSHKTDLYDFDMDKARDSRSRAPRTLADLNRLHTAHYRHPRAGR
jgi:hypothetical protein